MPSLDELMNLPGATGAIEFSCIGELGDMRGELERDFAEVVAQMCAANMAIYRMQATGWAKHTGEQGFDGDRRKSGHRAAPGFRLRPGISALQ